MQKPRIETKDTRIQKRSHYSEKALEPTDINILSEITNLSKDHFIRLFKKEVGTTPLQYINQKKIEKAQLILITEDMPVKNIALYAGIRRSLLFHPTF